MASQSATFSGPQNQGSQIAANSGTVNNYFPTRTVPPKSPRKPCSNVPFRRDDDFVDRGDLLAQVARRCSRPAGRAALVGFGGFGYEIASATLAHAYLRRKSQLAIEYAHRVHERSAGTWVFWVYASNSARLEASFSDIADTVGLTAQSETTVDTLQLVRRWLCDEGNGPWLMVVDNADTDITIETSKEKTKLSLSALLPQAKHGAVLVTSRNADVARTLVGREQDLVEVGTMSEEEAVDLLRKKLGDVGGSGGPELVGALDSIPLAIVQAAAYIVRLSPRMSVLKYFDELRLAEKQVQLLYKAAPDMRRDEGASNSAFKTWQISFDHIRQKQPSAAALLSFMCVFNSQGIPEFMMRHYTDRYGEEWETTSDGQLEAGDFEEDVAMLRALSLVSMPQREDEFNMHGLVQLATRIWLRSTGVERRWYTAFVEAMAEEFPDGEFTNWPRCQALFPHVLAVNEREGVLDRKTAGWALVLNNSGWYAWRQGLFTQAVGMVREAMEIRSELFDANTSSRLLSLGLLGSILTDLGLYKEAESVNRQTLARREKVLGTEHPDTLTSMSNLALVLRRQRKYEEAESMNRQTLARREKVLGAEHPDTLTSMSNLALVLDSQGKYEEAESMNRQTLARREKVLGAEHPDTLTSMGNLALVLVRRGKYEEAESMNRQTLARTEKVLGAEHPDTLTSMSNLAGVLDSQGKYEEAESMNRQTLVRYEKVLGAEHPDTMTSMGNLALVLDSQGKYEEAESMNRQTLARREKGLGAEHPDTLTSVYCLAHLLANRHYYSESAILYERACIGYSTALGEHHPTTRACQMHYRQILASQGQDHG